MASFYQAHLDVEVESGWKAGRVRYWQYGQTKNSPDLAISDLSAPWTRKDEPTPDFPREGFHPPKRSATFTSGILAGLLAQRGRSGPRPRAVAEPGILDEHEWLLTDLARKLEMPRATLHHWVRVGWVRRGSYRPRAATG